MHLDLREPTVVIAGAFNPAIFQLGWVASKLFGFEDGASVSATLVADLIQQEQRTYIGQVGLLAQPIRLMVFPDDLSEATVDRAERLIIRVAEILPHTPVAAIGINFKYVISNPGGELIDLIRPSDSPEKIGAVLGTEITSQIALEDDVKLNLSRSIGNDEVVIGFNFHKEVNSMLSIDASFLGSIMRLHEKSVNVMKELYEIEEDIEIVSALNRQGSGE